MTEQEHGPKQPTQELHIVQERKRFLPLCCFGVTWVSRGWEDPRDRHKLRKGEHPSTREYRRVRNDHPKAKKVCVIESSVACTSLAQAVGDNFGNLDGHYHGRNERK
eukprot:633022-Pelagomonas_calceolata.AAC.2